MSMPSWTRQVIEKTPSCVKVTVLFWPGWSVMAFGKFMASGMPSVGWQDWSRPPQMMCVSLAPTFAKVSGAPRLTVQETTEKLESSILIVLPQGVLEATGVGVSSGVAVAVGCGRGVVVGRAAAVPLVAAALTVAVGARLAETAGAPECWACVRATPRTTSATSAAAMPPSTGGRCHHGGRTCPLRREGVSRVPLPAAALGRADLAALAGVIDGTEGAVGAAGAAGFAARAEAVGAVFAGWGERADAGRAGEVLAAGRDEGLPGVFGWAVCRLVREDFDMVLMVSSGGRSRVGRQRPMCRDDDGLLFNG